MTILTVLDSITGGAETVRASLSTAGGFLQAPSTEGCQLHMAPPDASLVIVGDTSPFPDASHVAVDKLDLRHIHSANDKSAVTHVETP